MENKKKRRRKKKFSGFSSPKMTKTEAMDCISKGKKRKTVKRMNDRGMYKKRASFWDKSLKKVSTSLLFRKDIPKVQKKLSVKERSEGDNKKKRKIGKRSQGFYLIRDFSVISILTSTSFIIILSFFFF